MPTDTDGRRARGRARRAELIEAALAVLGRDGAAGLTHRAVAEEAGVPLASASYHFAGIQDLIEHAIEKANADFLAALSEQPRTDRSPAGLATLIADAVNDDRPLLMAEYEIYLYALRQPELAEGAQDWLDVIARTYAPDLSGAERRAFVALVEGTMIHALLAATEADANAIEASLRAGWPTPSPRDLGLDDQAGGA